MSLNRVSYLESWENSAFRRQRYQDQSSIADSDDDSIREALPEPSLSSSFPSIYSHHSLRHRLSFNPYAGPGWNQGSVKDANDDRQSLLGAGFDFPKADQTTTNAEEPYEHEPQPLVFKEPEWSVPETTGAFEVSGGKRIAQVCIAVIYCFLAAGVVFGFAAFKPVLIREGVYRNLCSPEELDKGVNVCYGQEIRLNLMFTIAAVATNVSALPVGTILDTYGPRVSGIIGSICLALGALLFTFAPHLPFDAYIPGYFFLSLGGPFVFISSFHLSNTFPTRSGLILSMLTGAFDASSALFLVFRLLNEKTNGSFSTIKAFSIYLVVPLFILIVQISIMPATSYKTVGELVQQAESHMAEEANDRMDGNIADANERERQRHDRRMQRHSIVRKIQDLLDDGSDAPSKINDPVFGTNDSHPVNNNNNNNSQPIPSPSHSTGGVWGAMHGLSALQQIRSPWFILITLFTILQMLRINYFVASLRQQYEYLLSSPARAKHINELFDLLLPLGGLLAVPFVGSVLDSLSTPAVLALLVAAATLIGILGCIPHSLPAAYANIALFVLYRPFYYTAVSDYAAKVFGFHTFGKVYGLVICLAGLANFAQPALDALTFKPFHGNPIPVNAALTVAAAGVGLGLVSFVWWRAREMAQEMDEAVVDHNHNHNNTAARVHARDRERQPLIPSENCRLSYGVVDE